MCHHIVHRHTTARCLLKETPHLKLAGWRGPVEKTPANTHFLVVFGEDISAQGFLSPLDKVDGVVERLHFYYR